MIENLSIQRVILLWRLVFWLYFSEQSWAFQKSKFFSGYLWREETMILACLVFGQSCDFQSNKLLVLLKPHTCTTASISPMVMMPLEWMTNGYINLWIVGPMANLGSPMFAVVRIQVAHLLTEDKCNVVQNGYVSMSLVSPWKNVFQIDNLIFTSKKACYYLRDYSIFLLFSQYL